MRTQNTMIVSFAILASCAGAKDESDLPKDEEMGQVSTPGGGAPTELDPNAPPPNNGLPEDESARDRPDYDPLECPKLQPVEGDSCDYEYILCTYGDSPRFDCRSLLECVDGTWRSLNRPDDCATIECPKTLPADDVACNFNGSSFSDEGIPCAYTRALCYCVDSTFENSAAETYWKCIEQPDKDCPAVQPNQGDPCDEQGKDCSYGFPCNGGGQWICRTGAWFFVPGECND